MMYHSVSPLFFGYRKYSISDYVDQDLQVVVYKGYNFCDNRSQSVAQNEIIIMI